jgi:hypothetical protein
VQFVQKDNPPLYAKVMKASFREYRPDEGSWWKTIRTEDIVLGRYTTPHGVVIGWLKDPNLDHIISDMEMDPASGSMDFEISDAENQKLITGVVPRRVKCIVRDYVKELRRIHMIEFNREHASAGL